MVIERINLMCALLNKSQAQIAKELDISRQTLNHVVNGTRKLDDITRKAILNHFDLPEKVFTQHTVHLTLQGNNLNCL